jgi:hypothetical protein
MAHTVLDQPERGPTAECETITIGGRRLVPTAVFDTYWRFALARQRVYLARLSGTLWTTDPILAHYRFTNCYRAADRVSQHLIRDVTYRGDQTWDEVFFRTVLFKLFNRSSTWQRSWARRRGADTASATATVC